MLLASIHQYKQLTSCDWLELMYAHIVSLSYQHLRIILTLCIIITNYQQRKYIQQSYQMSLPCVYTVPLIYAI